ncbi:hypothetical protein Sjap_015632 [Stephania japonica]|uniref:Calcineurin-like phosphoesterase domain-containing protein n=1 Tax=Stephania japonica TaxID=461633 RepID=A0AAP0IKA4_9MAGN
MRESGRGPPVWSVPVRPSGERRCGGSGAMAACLGRTSVALLCLLWILFMYNEIPTTVAKFQTIQHPPKADGYLSILVLGDWGRRGAYNQSQVAFQDLKQALSESTAEWKIVVGHHAIRSIGLHGDTKELVKQLLPILNEYNVDLYMNGHDHCLEHISSTKGSIQFLTTGAGSKAWRANVRDHEEGVKFYYDGQGFLSAELKQSEARIAYYDVFGQILHEFTLSKTLRSAI